MGDLTTKEAADKMGYSEKWVRDLLNSGRLQGYKQGKKRRWFIPEAGIERYLSPQSVEAVQGAKLEGSQGEGPSVNFQGNIPGEATNGPGLKGKNGEEPTQDAQDDQGEDGDQELNVLSGKCHESEEEPAEVKRLRPWALSYLGEVVDSEWSLNELERRGVPTKEAHRLLEVYARCCEWRWLFPLVNNKEFLTICFDLKVYREYVGIPRKLVNNYSFRFSRALDLDAQEEVQRIDRSLAHYSKKTMSIT